MEIWKNLQKGFTVNERLPGVVTNDCLRHVSGCLVQQKGLKNAALLKFGRLQEDQYRFV